MTGREASSSMTGREASFSTTGQEASSSMTEREASSSMTVHEASSSMTVQEANSSMIDRKTTDPMSKPERTDRTDDKPRAAIYCRLSEEDRDKAAPDQDSESIANQIMMLTQYAANHGWAVYDVYSDDNWTGADRTRPAFNRMLNDARAGAFDILLCKTQSRFSRELEIVEKYIHGLFPIWGIRFISIVDNADSNLPGNKKSRQIRALVDEWYLEDMSENIKSVLTARRKSGFYIGATPLYGYQKDPDRKGHLIVDPEAAKVVRLVFHSFADGMGKTAIARMLNDRGIPNPTEYKRLKGINYKNPKGRGGGLWKYSAISHMLSNEMYIGNLVQGRYGSVSYKSHINKARPKDQWIRCEGTHEAIIDQDLWNTVQIMLQERAKPFSDTGCVGLFAGKVRCRHCGYTMRSSRSHGKSYLKCSTRHVARDACTGSFIPAAALEEIVLTELKGITDLYLDREVLSNQIKIHNLSAERLDQLTEEKGRIRDRLGRVNNALKNLYMDKVTALISTEQYRTLSAGFEEDQKGLLASIERIDHDIAEARCRVREQKSKEDLIGEYVDLRELNRPIVEKMIDHIEVSKRDPDTRLVQVEIHWNI